MSEDPYKKYTVRELNFIIACRDYSNGPAPGLPGHNLMILVAKMSSNAGMTRQALTKSVEESAV